MSERRPWLMAKTTWGPAPWLPKQTWLLKDNSVLQTPDLETTASEKRVRVAGTTKSFGKNQIDEMLTDAVKEVAARRLTEPWVQLDDDDDSRRRKHGQMSPGPGTQPDYSMPATPHFVDPEDHGHTQITFEFVSEECPALTATMWVVINKRGYRNDDNYEFLSALTYPIVHENYPTIDYSSYHGDSWWTPYSYYAHGPKVEASKEFLAKFSPLPDFEFVNEPYGGMGARPAVTTAVKMVKQLRDVEYIDIPVWRGSETVSTMRFKFKRSNLTSKLYNDMIEFIQVKPTLDRIRENYRQIQRDLTSLGLVMKQKTSNDFTEIVEGAFAEDVVCHMIPMTEEGNPELDSAGSPTVVQDHAHTVSVDLLSGTIVVNCAQRDTEVLEHWNFERTKAELHGELDAFLGFARQKEQRRTRKKFNRIVKDRTPEGIDTDDLSA
jgi:hypothetical protein